MATAPDGSERRLGEEMPLALALGVVVAIAVMLITGEALLGGLAGLVSGGLVLGLIAAIQRRQRARHD